jgi:putative ABC transport system ATP-binding protein
MDRAFAAALTPSSLDGLAVLDGVRKVYRMGQTEVRALAGISLSISRGSFWAVMGPSGSGKSTLLNLLGCLDRPTQGRYVLNGQDVSALSDDALSELRLRELGFVFQSFNLIPQLSVQENIELPLHYQGWEMVGLAERLRHRPAELSGGEQQRVAIARALANSPAMLLADEPTGNLDSATGRQIMEMFVDLNGQGKTIILVTHEPDLAAFARSRLHMRDGLIDRLEGEA